MHILHLYFGVYMLCRFVGCVMIDNNTFTMQYASPLGDGIWMARGSCNTYFPSYTYNAHGSWMVARFGVPATNYKDYLSGQVIATDPDGRWLVTTVGYASGGGSLSYSLEFNYNVWLGSAYPSGDCHQFLDRSEAENFARNTPYPLDTPADTLIATVDLGIVSSGHTSSQGSCPFSFPGVMFGAREAVLLISFNVPVYYLSDYFGNIILHTDPDNTWYIVKDVYSRASYATYSMTFQFITSNQDLSTAMCYLYVSEADAVAAKSVTTLGWPTTSAATPSSVSSATAATNTAPPSTVVSNTSPPSRILSNTVQPTTIASNTSPSGTVVPIILPHTPRSNETSGYLVELQEMRNKYVGENCLWRNTDVNPLQCVRLCLADVRCVSAFHNIDRATCTGHKVVFGNGQSVSRVSYYVIL